MKQRNSQTRYLSQQPQGPQGRKSIQPDDRPGTSEEEEAFKVYVRVRPLNQRELDLAEKQRQSQSIVKVQDNLVILLFLRSLGPRLR